MNALETLKSDLISQIMNSSNEVLLRALADVFNTGIPKKYSTLSSAQIKMIQMGLEDIKHGRIISEDDVAIEDAKWMK